MSVEQDAFTGRIPSSADRVFWLTGLSGAGKSTLCASLSDALAIQGISSVILDADEFRATHSSDLGFSLEDRAENVRRMALYAAKLSQSHELVLVGATAPLRSMRETARTILGKAFVEVFVSAPLEVCEKRDYKGLYARFRADNIRNMVGLDSPYETPLHPDLVCHTERASISECVEELLHLVHSRRLDQSA